MSGVVALVVWIIIAVIALALFVWWWRGVHAKSKEEQASDVLVARSGAAARRLEKSIPGAMNRADTGEYRKGTAEPPLPPTSREPFIPPQDPAPPPPAP